MHKCQAIDHIWKSTIGPLISGIGGTCISLAWCLTLAVCNLILTSGLHDHCIKNKISTTK